MAKKGRKLSKISKEILRAIYFYGPAVLNSIFTPAPGEYQAGAFRVKYREPYKKFSPQQMNNLRRAGYIKKDNQSLFHLTPKGRLEALRYLRLEKIFKKKWDGRWRIIIFDIPEDRRKARDFVRNELRALEFYQLQKSVYITPYPVKELLDKTLNENNIRKYFRYVTVSEIDGEEELKKIFAISN